jgi:hypothetical protein
MLLAEVTQSYVEFNGGRGAVAKIPRLHELRRDAKERALIAEYVPHESLELASLGSWRFPAILNHFLQFRFANHGAPTNLGAA